MTRDMNPHHIIAKAATVQRKRRQTAPASIAKKPTSPATIVRCSPLPSPKFSGLLVSARPCQRCIKRGLASNCTEGHRKKAKYLLDEDELGQFPPPIDDIQSRVHPEQLKRTKSSVSAPDSSAEPPTITPCTPPLLMLLFTAFTPTSRTVFTARYHVQPQLYLWV